MASLAIPPATSGGSSLVLPNGRSEGVISFEAGIVDFFVEAAAVFSVRRSEAAIYGLLFASAQPLSFAEISARLDLSNGSISQGLRALREIGAIREVSSAADRAEIFTPDTEMRQIIVHFLESRVDGQLKAGSAKLDALRPSLRAYAGEEQKILKERVKKLEAWNAKTRALLPLIRTFLKLGA